MKWSSSRSLTTMVPSTWSSSERGPEGRVEALLRFITGARMAVDVGKDLQCQLAAQVGYDVDPPACGGVPQPLAAAAGMHARHAVVVVAKSVEPVLGRGRRVRSRPPQFQLVVADIGFAGVAVVVIAAVDAQQVAPAPRRQVEREPVRGAADDVGEGARQRGAELLGGEHALQEQVGVVAYLVQVMAGRGDQQAHHRAPRVGVAMPLGALREALQAAHRRRADGGVEVERRVGAARVQPAQERLPAGAGDAHRTARRRQFLVGRYESQRRLAQHTVERFQGGALPCVDRLHMRVAGLDGTLFEAQDETQPLPRRRGAAVPLRGHLVEQPQPEVDGRHPVPDRSLPDPGQHRGLSLFEQEGGAGQLADQHDAPRRRGGAAAALVRHQQVVGQAYRIAEPLHEPRIALHPFARRRTVRRRGRQRLGAHGNRQPLPLAGIAALPRGARRKRKRALLPERTLQRGLDRRLVNLRPKRHGQTGAAPDARRRPGTAINFIWIHRVPHWPTKKSECVPSAF